jgi:hypothetical protein
VETSLVHDEIVATLTQSKSGNIFVKGILESAPEVALRFAAVFTGQR